MKTLHPIILTARIAERDLEPFDLLRQAHFPPDRNFLTAHLTMFHRLPGEYSAEIFEHLLEVAAGQTPIEADVTGLRHLGSGVAFAIASPELESVHARLRAAFIAWLGGQDMQKWQPHITIQNKVSRSAADALRKELVVGFQRGTIAIVGLDLWKYLGGPWQHETFALFGKSA